MSFNAIPIIDFSGVRSGNPATLERVGKEIREACTRVGFFYIVHHDLPQSSIDAVLQASKTFFALPETVKREVAVNHRHRGWHAIGGATMYQAKRPDLKEFFSIGLDLPEDDPDVLAGQPLRGPNQWPDSCPELRDSLSCYYEEVGKVGQDLLRCVAVSLDLEPDFFITKYRKPLQRTQVVYYPEHPADSDENLFGVAPHTDYGCITLLYQDNSGGLQARNLNGEWIDATPVEGSLVINVGDLLQRWSNDRFISTPHRVINRSGHKRYSIATFYDPTYDAIVDPCDLGTPLTQRRHSPMAAGDYILQRINDSMAYRKTKVPQTK